jgi:hypothetical protein
MHFLVLFLLPKGLLRALAWRTIERKGITGTLVTGDKDARPSSPNQARMIFVRLSWKKVVIVKVETGDDSLVTPFYVGYRTAWGQVFACDQPIVGKGFCAKLGNEDVTFFALSASGTELPVTTLAILTKEEAAKHYSKIDYPRI